MMIELRNALALLQTAAKVTKYCNWAKRCEVVVEGGLRGWVGTLRDVHPVRDASFARKRARSKKRNKDIAQ
jgi:hypothetical protein